ncbi:MAG TPA: GNAT family N-acetyltransferase [Thermoplasmata archaeon]|nr:GNAT family N-acetyltransferase [Thermoplasmata archaeon]
MAGRTGRVHHGLDLAWLQDEAGRDPVAHAYGLWDALHEPERTRFVRWDGEDGARSYLLIWYGDPSAPVVHWVGRSPLDLDLVGEIPPTAQVVVVPERAAWAVLKQRRIVEAEPLLALAREPGPPASAPRRSDVRRLDADDAGEVGEFVRKFPDRLTVGYPRLDLSRETVWGAFDGDRLAGLARAPVRLPSVWIIGGVYVAPNAQRRGHGRALMRAAVASAVSAGARPSLFVRESNAIARHLYGTLGFRETDRKVWIDLARATPTT